MWLQKIAEIKIGNRFCVTEIRMNILRLYSTYVVYLWTETGKGKILCIMRWVKAINHVTIQKSDTVSSAYNYIFQTKRTFFFLRLMAWENDMKMTPFIWILAWGTDLKASLGRRTKIKPLGRETWLLPPCHELLLVSAVTNGKMERLWSACTVWP